MRTRKIHSMVARDATAAVELRGERRGGASELSGRGGHALGDRPSTSRPAACVTPSRQSPASIVRFWWLTISSCASRRNSCDQAEEAVQVDVVERGLDLVHHVERRRPAAEHGEQVRQRGQAALAARQQRQLLHVLAARLGLDLDAGVQQVVGVWSARACPTPPGNSGANSWVKCALTSANAAANTRLDLEVDGLDHPQQVAAGAADVLELRLEERVPLLQLVELLERERVDRARAGAARGRGRARAPAASTPSGSARQLGGLGDRSGSRS